MTPQAPRSMRGPIPPLMASQYDRFETGEDPCVTVAAVLVWTRRKPVAALAGLRGRLGRPTSPARLAPRLNVDVTTDVSVTEHALGIEDVSPGALRAVRTALQREATCTSPTDVLRVSQVPFAPLAIRHLTLPSAHAPARPPIAVAVQCRASANDIDRQVGALELTDGSAGLSCARRDSHQALDLRGGPGDYPLTIMARPKGPKPPMPTVTFTIPADLLERLDSARWSAQKSRSQVVVEAIRAYLPRIERASRKGGA